jgi:hypothetical protein
MVSNRSGDATTPLGVGMVPISRFGSAQRPCSFRYFALRAGLAMMSVGPFLLLNQPYWQTLDQKELFNKLQGSVCAGHGMCYTGRQLRVELASSTAAALHESEHVTAHPLY